MTELANLVSVIKNMTSLKSEYHSIYLDHIVQKCHLIHNKINILGKLSSIYQTGFINLIVSQICA